MPSEVSMSGAGHDREPTVEELRRELAEAHRREAVTGEILKVISRSAYNLQSVLDTLVESAAILCEAEIANIWRPAGATYRLAASYGVASLTKDWLVYKEFLAGVANEPGRGSCVGRTLLERRTVQIDDVRADREYDQRGALASVRTMLGVPLLRDGNPIGVMILVRATVRPFAAKQIELIETFADQAVIAIENTRLLNELRESLQQQTATADVLKVISRSALDVQRVLDALVESAAHLCNAYDAAIFLVFGDGLRLVAHDGQIPTTAPVGQHTIPLVRGQITRRAAIDRRTIQVADMLAEEEEYPQGQQNALRVGYRTALAVPLVHAGAAIGVILMRRAEVRPFTDRQIELVNTFADQAVIAIENTRLFEAEQASKRELQESLKYQTAISEVLSVISRSQTEIRPVFDAILESAVRLCDADQGGTGKVENGMLVAINWYPDTPEISTVFRDNFPRPFDRTSLVGRAVIEGRVLHVPDLEAPDAPKLPTTLSKAFGYRSQLTVPLVRNGQPIGVLALVRKAPEPFTPPQIALATTFADQAVIAIENTRLFDEVQARTRELAKTVEHLEIASQHKNQFVANMSHELRTPLAAILGYAELIQEGFYGPQPEKSLDALTRIRSNGKHLLGLINTVLDIAKIESGQFSLNMAEYAIDSVVETVRSATESLAQNKKLEFKTDVATPLPIGIGDEQRLTQVLLNLVGNAIKFTDAGEVCVAAGAANGHFTVSVSDTGPGIPAEECERIFEKFRQVDSSNTRAKGGTGLGLAIAREIVQMHGGRIWVESTLGHGSTFHMQLPVRAVAPRGAA